MFSLDHSLNKVKNKHKKLIAKFEGFTQLGLATLNEFKSMDNCKHMLRKLKWSIQLL